MNAKKIEATAIKDFDSLSKEVQKNPQKEIILSDKDLNEAKEAIEKHLKVARKKVEEIKEVLSTIKFTSRDKVVLLHREEYKKTIFIALVMEKLWENLLSLELCGTANILGYKFFKENLEKEDFWEKSGDEIKNLFISYSPEKLIMEKLKVVLEYENLRILKNEDLLFEVDVTPEETVRIPYKDVVKFAELIYSAKIIEKPKIYKKDEIEITFGRFLKNLREKKGWSLREAEVHTKIPFSSLAAFEKNKIPYKTSIYKKLAKAYDVKEETLYQFAKNTWEERFWKTLRND